jgi:mannose-6-phosphate isomerase-like protein (cupin superfamily)
MVGIVGTSEKRKVFQGGILKKLNRILIGIAVLVIASGLAHNHAQDKSSASPVYVEHQKVDASYKHSLPIPDLFAGQSGNANYRVRASRHDDPTEVEIHTLDTDIFYVTTGTATFVAGGTAPDAKQISPTELRGKTINGATTYNLSQGDVIVVPRGIPHQFQAIPSAPFLYMEVKVR